MSTSILVVSVIFASGCFNGPNSPNNSGNSTNYSDGGNAGNNGNAANPSGTTQTITASQKQTAQTKVDAANAALENSMPPSGDSIIYADFSAANAFYKAALDANPNNTQAQFGAAVTELLISNQNKSLEMFLDSFTVSSSSSSSGSLFKSRIISVKPGLSMITGQEKVLMKLANLSADQVPKISDLQEVIKDTVLPKFTYALDRFSIVENDPSFSFNITPKMRGLLTGDTLILGRGEIYTIDACLRIVRALLLTLIAYNVDIDDNRSYEWLSSNNDSMKIVMMMRLWNTPSFLALNSYGADAMRSCIDNLRKSIDKLHLAISTIKADTGIQLHHVIKAEFIDSANAALRGNGSNATITTITQALDSVSYYLSRPYAIKIDDTRSLTINISAVFDNPIQDLKSKFPYFKFKAPSQWRDTAGVYYTYAGNGLGDYTWKYNAATQTSAYDYTPGSGAYDREVPMNPIELTTANGTVKPDTAGPDFPDYTFGGLFPTMTTRQQWVDISASTPEHSPTGPTTSRALSKIGFTWMKK